MTWYEFHQLILEVHELTKDGWGFALEGGKIVMWNDEFGEYKFDDKESMMDFLDEKFETFGGTRY